MALSFQNLITPVGTPTSNPAGSPASTGSDNSGLSFASMITPVSQPDQTTQPQPTGNNPSGLPATGVVPDIVKGIGQDYANAIPNFLKAAGSGQSSNPIAAVGEGALASTASGISTIFSPITQTISKLSDALSNNPTIQKMVSGNNGFDKLLDAVGTAHNAINDWSTKNPELSSNLNNALTVGTAALGGEAEPAVNEGLASAGTKIGEGINAGSRIISDATSKTVDAIKGKFGDIKSSITNKIAGKSSADILATPEEDVAKLSPADQKSWYRNQAQQSSQQAASAMEKSKAAEAQDLANTQKKIQDFNQKIGESSRSETIDLKEPARKLMQTSSAKYVQLSGEAADGSPALAKTTTASKLSAAIDSKFEYNQEVGNSLKEDLGINEKPEKPTIDQQTKLPVIKAEAPPEVKLTNQQILDKAREIIQTVSKTARQGNRTYSFPEYQAMQKYSFLMEQLSNNGVDMTEANNFWKSWAPTRDRIVSEIKPFDETNIKKMPFTNTLNRAASVAKTSGQTASKIDAQNFISELETRMKLPKGSIGSETKAAVEGLEKEKLSQDTIKQVSDEAEAKIKADKADAANKRYWAQNDTLRQQRINSIIKKTLIGLGIWGVAKVTGLDKPILGVVSSIL